MIRVGLVQALIPHYREPVFKELASREGIDLTMYADLGARHGSLHGARSGSGFTVIDAKERYIGPLLVDPATIRAARGGHDVLVMSWRMSYSDDGSSMSRLRANARAARTRDGVDDCNVTAR